MTARAAAFLALPGALLVLGLFILPALSVFPTALTDWEFGKRNLSFVGFDNFAELAADARFRAALSNTLLYTAVITPLTVALGLAIAMAIDGAGRLKPLYRTAHFLPVVATMAAMSVAWEAVLHPSFGLLNNLLAVFGAPRRNWLQDEALVLPTLMAIGVWKNLGFAVIMFLAGLQAMPRELVDAAAIDGAVRPLDRLRVLTLPVLSPVTAFVTVVTAKQGLEVFDSVAVLTRGGPGQASEVLLHLLYTESFKSLRAGYGSAIVVVLLVLMLGLVLTHRALDGRRVGA